MRLGAAPTSRRGFLKTSVFEKDANAPCLILSASEKVGPRNGRMPKLQALSGFKTFVMRHEEKAYMYPSARSCSMAASLSWPRPARSGVFSRSCSQAGTSSFLTVPDFVPRER